MNESCHRYLEDPESDPSHADECEACRDAAAKSAALEQVLGGVSVDPSGHSLDPRDLPVAPWEGAAHRTWPLALAVITAILAVALALFLISGVKPAEGFRQAVTGQFPGPALLRLAVGIGETLLVAPPLFHVAVVGGFLLVNLLFYRLLRREPRGIDVTSR